MVQEDLALNRRLASFERRIKDLERLITLGLVGNDVEATLQQHTALLGKLIGDPTLGNVLIGPFPSADAPQGFRTDGGNFYQSASMGIWGTPVNDSIIVNRLYATPFYMPRIPNFVDEIAIRVIAAESGKNARLGIYEDNGSVYPGVLIKDAGTVSMGTTGPQKITVNEALPRGLMWLAIVTDATTAVTTATVSNSGGWNLLGSNPVDLVPDWFGWFSAFTFGVLPTVFPAGSTEAESVPVVYLSFKPGSWS